MAPKESSVLKKLTWSHITMSAAIVGFLFSIFGFVRNTQSANKDIPEIKSQLIDHEKNDNAKDILFVNTLNEIKLSVKDIQGEVRVVSTKVDDFKQYGVGQYHREAREAIEKNK